MWQIKLLSTRLQSNSVVWDWLLFTVCGLNLHATSNCSTTLVLGRLISPLLFSLAAASLFPEFLASFVKFSSSAVFDLLEDYQDLCQDKVQHSRIRYENRTYVTNILNDEWMLKENYALKHFLTYICSCYIPTKEAQVLFCAKTLYWPLP